MKRFLIAALAQLALVAGTAQAFAEPTLRAETRVHRDVVTLGDLVEGADPKIAALPLFGAPRLGESGTIQTSRVLTALRPFGLDEIELNGITQVVVVRPARRIGAAEVEAAVQAALSARLGRDASNLSLVFDGPIPALALPLSVDGPLKVEDMVHDPRARRVSANLAVAAADGSQRRAFRIVGAVVETAPVAVLSRAIGRGETVEARDITIERRPRDMVPADGIADLKDAVGQVARRALGAGGLVRAADLAKPEVVQRGEVVTIVYEAGGIVITTRGKAGEAGGVGDTIPVQNIQSKRMLQGTISGPGRISITAGTPGPLASATR